MKQLVVRVSHDLIPLFFHLIPLFFHLILFFLFFDSVVFFIPFCCFTHSKNEPLTVNF